MAIPPAAALSPQAPGAQAPTNRITVYGRTFEVVLYTTDAQGRKTFQQMGSFSSADLQNIQTLAIQALAVIGQSPHWANVTGIDHNGITVSTPGQQPQQHAHQPNLWTPVEQAVNAAPQGGAQPANAAAAPAPGGAAPIAPRPPLPVPANVAIRAPHLSLFQQPNAPAVTQLNQLTYAQFSQLPPRARLRALTHIQNGTIQVANPQPTTLTQDIATCTAQINALPTPLLDNTTRQAIDTLYAATPDETIPAQIQTLLSSNFTGKEHLIDYYNEMARAQGVTTPSLQLSTNDPSQFITFWQQPMPSTATPAEYANACWCLIEALAYFADEDAAPITNRQPLPGGDWGMLGSVARGAASVVTGAVSVVTTIASVAGRVLNWAFGGSQQPQQQPAAVPPAQPQQQAPAAAALPKVPPAKPGAKVAPKPAAKLQHLPINQNTPSQVIQIGSDDDL